MLGCGAVADGVVLELNVMQRELKYVLHVLFGSGLFWSERYQTPASGLGSGNLCSRRVFRYPTALASYFEVNGSDLVLLQ